MTCSELDILLCDYLDGTLSAGDARSVETHLESCPACAEVARDARLAMSFMERAAEVEPPPQLMTRILHETASGRHGRLGRPSGIRAWFERAAGAGVAAPPGDGDGADDPFVLHDGALRGNLAAAVAAKRYGPEEDLGVARRPGSSGLGAAR